MLEASRAFLRELVSTPSPSGYEEKVAAVYREYVGGFADEVATDVHGNTWGALNPRSGMRIMLAGHMDEIGFQIHHIDEKGFLYFRGIGGHDTMVPLGNRVWVHGTERVAGVIGRKPIHLLDSAEKDKRPELHDLWIDIGATSRSDAETVVKLGDCVTYQWEYQELKGSRAVGRGFDNLVGTFVVAEALRLLKDEGGLDPGVGVYAVATVQEEIGLRGARTSAFGIGAQTGLAVDVDFATDHPGLSASRYGALELGKGPSVTRGANINPVVFQMLTQAAVEEEIAIQISAEPGGTGTDANAMQLNQAGMATGLVGVPLRYMHTPCELLDLADVESCARLLAAYCRCVKPGTDFTPKA